MPRKPKKPKRSKVEPIEEAFWNALEPDEPLVLTFKSGGKTVTVTIE